MSGTAEDPLAPLRASPLWQAVFKLEWAHKQFSDAADLMAQYTAQGKVGIREHHDQTGHKLILFSERLPAHLPLCVGTGIHSLRSSLDTAVSILMEGMTGARLDRVNFPFHQTERELRDEFSPRPRTKPDGTALPSAKPKRAELMEHLPEFVEMLFDVFRPWEGGNFPLWALNKLDNLQKHRLLLLVLTATSGGVDHYDPAMRLSSFTGNKWIIQPGTEAIIAQSRIQIVETGPRWFNSVVALPTDIPLGGEPLFEVVSQLYEVVESVLIALHSRFDGHKALS